MAEGDRDLVAVAARWNRTHASVFAVGAVLLRADGEEEVFFANALLLGPVDPFVRDNLAPAVADRSTAQCGWQYTHPTRRLMRDAFWAWLSARSAGAVVLTDSGWPAATLLLSACLNDAPDRRASASFPRPLHELATLELAAGMDPGGADARALEPPQHRRGDPVCDARLAALVARRALRLTTAAASSRRELEVGRGGTPPPETCLAHEAPRPAKAERPALTATATQPQGDTAQ